MKKGADTRQRMIEATARLLRRDGYAATGWRAVVDEAGTPWGSAHHHFPGGKEQLAAEAVALGGEQVAALLEHALTNCAAEGEGVAQAVRRWYSAATEHLINSGFSDGCPVATVALETAPRSPRLSKACAAAVEQWQARLDGALSEAGIAPTRAAQLATLIVVNLEGALLVARLSRDTGPLTTAADFIAALLTTELADAGPAR